MPVLAEEQRAGLGQNSGGHQMTAAAICPGISCAVRLLQSAPQKKDAVPVAVGQALVIHGTAVQRQVAADRVDREVVAAEHAPGEDDGIGGSVHDPDCPVNIGDKTDRARGLASKRGM